MTRDPILDLQQAFDIAVALIGTLGGVVMTLILQRMNKNEKSHDDLTLRVHAIDVMVAGKFVAKDDYRRDLDALHDRQREQDAKQAKFQDQVLDALNRIHDKLDHKADKAGKS